MKIRWRGTMLLSVRVGYWLELKRWPVPGRMFIWEGAWPRAWYHVKCAVWHRYNVVKISTLSAEGSDADDLVLHSAFQILGEIRPRLLEQTEATGDPSDKHSWAFALNEVEALWLWWTVEYPEMQAEQSRRLMAWHDAMRRDLAIHEAAHPDWRVTGNPHLQHHMPNNDEWRTPEQQRLWARHQELSDDVIHARENEMLHRLINIRCCLWT